MRIIQLLSPVILFAAGLYFLRIGFHDYADFRMLLAQGDPSGAEVYEIGFWLNGSASAFFVFLAGVFTDRWWFQRRK